jgi:hypothetical protein
VCLAAEAGCGSIHMMGLGLVSGGGWEKRVGPGLADGPTVFACSLLCLCFASLYLCLLLIF